MKNKKCPFCEKYKKTIYYTITRKNVWPKNLVSGRPIKIFGIYLFALLKLENKDYQWGKVNDDYKKEYYTSEPIAYLCPIHESIIFSDAE
jgi:hypothetical protein